MALEEALNGVEGIFTLFYKYRLLSVLLHRLTPFLFSILSQPNPQSLMSPPGL
jgi:hypothetical protein